LTPPLTGGALCVPAVLTALWAMPWFKSGPAATRFLLLGGRQLDAIKPGGGNRPNVVAGQSPNSGTPLLSRWFNTGAVHLRQCFAHDSERVRDGVENIDCSLFKDFRLKEKYTLQFDKPVNNVQSTTFGRSDCHGIQPQAPRVATGAQADVLMARS